MRFFLLFLCSFSSFFVSAQSGYKLSDGIESQECSKCREIIESRPKEVLFGIHFINDEVYFSITSEQWFKKIFSQPGDGVTADIVSKDQFKCGRADVIKDRGWNKGTPMRPVLLPEMKKRMQNTGDGSVLIKLGPVPASLKGKELEGNLVIIRNNKVCYYSNFTNIDRILWELLDVGLYTDTLIQSEPVLGDKTEARNLYYTRKAVVTIPFQKGKASFLPADIQPLYDSLSLEGFKVRKIEIRAFSSVEGAVSANIAIQNQRAQSIVAAIQSFQKETVQTQISSGENWMQFIEAIEGTPFSYLKNYTKQNIKKQLSRKTLLDSLENLLASQRKAVVTLYMNAKTAMDEIPSTELAQQFSKAIKENHTERAIALQQTIFERIIDNKLPSNYLNDLAIPAGKPFSRLLNDQQVYRYLLNEISEDDAIKELKKLEQLDPQNGKIRYNLCALQMRLWQFNEKAVNKEQFLIQIQQLSKMGIPQRLVNRMLINYKILLCEVYMKQGKYDEKDKVLEEIKEHYIDKNLSDRDLLALGKYFSAYGQYEWADEVIFPRMDQLDVSEDLLFFYINLSLFVGNDLTEGDYNKMLLNAISINTDRFCRFFNSIDNGGISMQLLLDSFWKGLYCENCNYKTVEKSL